MAKIPLEAWAWILGLIGLVTLAPYLEGSVTLCIPSMLGVEECWGCGLGRSIALLVRGDFSGSIASHPLGIPAILIITSRIVQLVRQRRINH